MKEIKKLEDNLESSTKVGPWKEQQSTGDLSYHRKHTKLGHSSKTHEFQLTWCSAKRELPVLDVDSRKILYKYKLA